MDEQIDGAYDESNKFVVKLPESMVDRFPEIFESLDNEQTKRMLAKPLRKAKPTACDGIIA